MVAKVREKKGQEWNFTQISHYFHLDTRTVTRYCDISIDTLNDHQFKENALEVEKYLPQPQKLLLEHNTLEPAYEALVKLGFSRTFHTFVITYKKALERLHTRNKLVKKVHRRPILQLLLSSAIDYSDLDKDTRCVLDTVPEIKIIIEDVLDFRNLLKNTILVALDQWLDNVRELNNKHLNSFILSFLMD